MGHAVVRRRIEPERAESLLNPDLRGPKLKKKRAFSRPLGSDTRPVDFQQKRPCGIFGASAVYPVVIGYASFQKS